MAAGIFGRYTRIRGNTSGVKIKIFTLQLILGFNLHVEVWFHAFLKCRHQIYVSG